MTEANPASAAAPAAPRPRTPRWVMAVLVLSLAVNALVIGVVLRFAWHVRGAAAMSVDGLPATLGSYVGQLPPNRREELRRELGEGRQQFFPLRRDLQLARREAANRFIAEPLDKEAFVAALRRVQAAENKLREAMQTRMPEIAATMTVEERRAFVRWWGGNREGRGRPPGGDGERPGPPGRWRD